MPSVAVVYYSQTGQSQRIATALQSAYTHAAIPCTLVKITPERPYTFPWKITEFFEQMPYCMEGISPEIEDVDPRKFDDFDHIVLVHPVWFLSASLPIQSFLKLPQAEKIFRSKKVIQILTCRNMWFSAAKKTRNALVKLGANYCGEIVLEDASPNWASLVTTPRWMFTGKKNAFAFFPPAGISEGDFENFTRSGKTKVDALFDQQLSTELEKQKMPRAKALSICLEIFGHNYIFSPWAKVISKAPRFLSGTLLFLFRLNLVSFLLIAVPTLEIVSRILSYPFCSYAKKQQLRLRGLHESLH